MPRPLAIFPSVALALTVSFHASTAMAQPQGGSIAFKQAIAEAAAQDEGVQAFYVARGFAPIWTGAGEADRVRRAALLAAMEEAPHHGIPAARYDRGAIEARLAAVSSADARAATEVWMTRQYLAFARDVQTGMLEPGRIDPGLVREVPVRPASLLLEGVTGEDPAAFLATLAPQSPEYARLMKHKMLLRAQLDLGGWGPAVRGGKLSPGASGSAVVALRNRLIAMGHLPRTTATTYDDAMTEAVRAFQAAHGITVDGVAGPGTLAEINVPLEDRLKAVMVAMERERWINMPRGERHIWVNLTDFKAKIMDRGEVTFETRSVIGHRDVDRRSPEFSDVMDHMVINPSWFVPRSIATQEYLPQLRRNPFAVGHLEITDSRGRVVNRGAVNFAQYTETNFPFNMRQPPSPRNALGLVKFMFPNKYNIYLHDTPAKSLFGREVRTFSHGCIRLNDPFEFAHALLAAQEDDPVGFFRRVLNTNAERRVNLEAPVPVHLVYRTAIANADGTLEFRRDVYGRDARIWAALVREGVEVRPAQS
ncbi:MAG: L,D-transpeptidase family protein [Shimia sp.]